VNFQEADHFPFMATRKVWYTLSAILMIGSVVSFATRGLNLGSTSRAVSARRRLSRRLPMSMPCEPS